MYGLKVGDKVERIKDEFAGMKVGDTAIITTISNTGVILDKYNTISRRYHSPSSLKFVAKEWDE